MLYRVRDKMQQYFTSFIAKAIYRGSIVPAMTLQNRMKEARKRAGLKQRELAEKAGVATSTISNAEAGRRETCREVVAIAKVLNVRPEWLAHGDGNMNFEIPFPPPGNEKIHVVLMTPEELDLLTDFRSATKKGQKFIKDACEAAEKLKIMLPVSDYKP